MFNIVNVIGQKLRPPFFAQLHPAQPNCKTVKIHQLEISSINSNCLQEISASNMNDILKEFFKSAKIFPSWFFYDKNNAKFSFILEIIFFPVVYNSNGDLCMKGFVFQLEFGDYLSESTFHLKWTSKVSVPSKSLFFRINDIKFESPLSCRSKDGWSLASASSDYTNLILSNGVVYQPMPKVTKSFHLSSLNCDQFKIYDNIPPELGIERDKLSHILKSFSSKKSNFDLPSVLAFGKSGCGKSAIFKSLSLTSGLPFYSFDCCFIKGDNSGLTEGKLKQVFALVREMRPCIMELRNIDMLAKTPEGKLDERVLSALMNEMKGLRDPTKEKYVLLIGETSLSPSSVIFDSKLANIFDIQVPINLPIIITTTIIIPFFS